MSEDSSSLMYLMPTEGAANDFSKTRIEPMIKASPVLKELFSGNTRDSDNTIELKTFPSGYVAIYGASTPTKLASKPIRILLADEIDRFPLELPREGDPLKLAMQRTTNFFNRKILLISTPTTREKSRIVAWFEKSDKRYYYVPCPDCGHEFVLNWEMVKWEKNENNELIIESVYLECPACSYHIVDRHKPELLANGRWVRTAEHKTTPGFHISSLYAPWVKFWELATEFIEATRSRDKSKLREFINLKLGEPFEEAAEEIEIETLQARREYYNCDLPEGVLYLTVGVDVQDDRLECQVVGWGIGKESWIIEYNQLYGNPTGDEVWQKLDEQLFKSYSFADGRKLSIAATAIDSGGHHTSEVYKFVKPRRARRIHAVIGRAGAGRTIAGNFMTNNKAKVMLYTIGVDNAKATLYQRLQLQTIGPGFIHFPFEPEKRCDDFYLKGLLSEKLVMNFKNGKKKWEWKKIVTRNEPLDTFVYALGAMEIYPPNFERLKRDIAELPKEIKPLAKRQISERKIVSSLNLYDE
jgi:phage terminase large subunit GpA-like protein